MIESTDRAALRTIWFKTLDESITLAEIHEIVEDALMRPNSVMVAHVAQILDNDNA